MFEDTLHYLIADYHTLLERMQKGKEMIDTLPEKSGEVYDSYVRQYNYLKVLAFRASTCLDILEGDVILIAEEGGALVVVKRVDEKARKLIEEAQKLGGILIQTDMVERR